ncbi:MAG: hypothetical protein NC241_05660 [Bacteroides sp.]|nr:hypothetical protein [Bacteroides sp.]
MKEKLIALILIILWSNFTSFGQFVVSPNGVLIDSISGKDYVVIEKE